MPQPEPVTLVDVLDQESAPVAVPVAVPPTPALPAPGTPCGAQHHSDPTITCERQAGHEQTAEVARELHAAKHLWNVGDVDPTWATWA